MFLYTIGSIGDCHPPLLPDGMSAYVSDSRSESQERERLCAASLLCTLLHAADIRTDLTIIRDKNGRPRFDSENAPDFNISHSGGLCACILGNLPVGIDIQEEKPDLKPRRLAGRFFSPAERKNMSAIASNTTDAFFTVWTKKEALGKYLGCGIAPVLGTDTREAPEKFGITFGCEMFRYGDKVFCISTCAAEIPTFVVGENSLSEFPPLSVK